MNPCLCVAEPAHNGLVSPGSDDRWFKLEQFSMSLRGQIQNGRMQRRSFLGVGVAGAMTTRVASLAEAASEGRKAQAKNVLVILEQGGLSHMDTWDPKTEAVAEHRAPLGLRWRPSANLTNDKEGFPKQGAAFPAGLEHGMPKRGKFP